MELNTQVAVISIFGRGHWIATELARRGIPTTLLDISDQMGFWTPEDWEGPFGFFKSEKLKPTQVERILEGDAPMMVPQGFSFWLEEGPLELKGPVSKHRLSALNIPEVVQDYLQGSASNKELKALSFEQNWLAQFAHAYSSTRASLSPEALGHGSHVPLFSTYFIKQASRPGLQKSIKWCESHGVQVPSKVSLQDISLSDRKTLSGFEIKTEKPGLLKAEQFVICLTSEELGMISTKVQHTFFPKGPIEPEWSWMRYRISLKENYHREQLPLHFVVIENKNMPWYHENFLVVQASAVTGSYDVWCKVPSAQRFNKQYLADLGLKIIKTLDKKMVDAEPQIQSYPQEHQYNYSEVGPSRHPVYSKALDVKGTILNDLSNVTFDSPETWDHLGEEGMLNSQIPIVENLKNWWAKKEELRIKREQKELKESKKGSLQ